MTELAVLRHIVEPCIKLIARCRVEVRLRNFSAHLVAQLCEKRTALGLNFDLQIYKKLEIFVFLFGVLKHKLRESFPFDIVGDNSPFAVHKRHLMNLRNIKPRFFDSCLIKCFAQNIGFGIRRIKHLHAEIAVAVYRLVVSDRNYSIEIHYLSIFLLATLSMRFCMNTGKYLY